MNYEIKQVGNRYYIMQNGKKISEHDRFKSAKAEQIRLAMKAIKA